MKTPILKAFWLCAFTLCNMVSYAQYEWWPVHPGHKLYYSIDTALSVTSKSRQWGITIVDSQTIANGTRYYFNRFLINESQTSPFDCPYTNFTNPLGLYMDIKGDSCMLYTDNLHGILFNKSTQLGDSIYIPKTLKNEFEVTIKYVRIDHINIFGIMDSVRIYSVKSNPVYGCFDSIVLSKSFGLIRIPNIRFIDRLGMNQSYDRYHNAFEWSITGTMQLNAHSHIPSMDLQPLTYFDCFNFSVGDVKHIVQNDVRNTYAFDFIGLIKSQRRKKVIIETVTGKVEYNDSVVYELNQHIYNDMETKTPGSYWTYDTTYNRVQFVTVLKTNHEMDTILPGSVYFNKGISKYVRNNAYGLPAVEQIATSHFTGLSDSCIVPTFDVGPEGHRVYVKNVGGPYFSDFYSDVISGTSDWLFENKLIYYSNSSGTWGTPYPFPLGLNTNTGDKTSIINVYPNPASEQFTIASKDTQAITITDITGKIVYKNNLVEPITSIDCLNWPAGVYLLQTQNDGIYHRIKLIITH